jgi:tRNA pseudouridine38-40 synthase
MRIKLTISYNGAPFMGLQSQTTTADTIIGTLQSALKRLGIESKAVASGRTDRGVHAYRQVLHFDLPEFWSDLEKLERSLTRQLPDAIHIRRLEKAADDFHARYGAKRRVYRYILSTKEPNPFEADFVTFVPSLDHEKIAEAIRLFEGTHDFDYFKKSGSDVTDFVRTVYKARLYRRSGYTVLYFEANGFLRAQIRLMVGFLLGISEGKLTEKMLREQLACEKQYKVKPAPHNGLYLSKIIY